MRRTLLPAILLVPVLSQAQTGTSNGEWRFHGADPGATRYAPLGAIDASIVAKLEIAWTFSTRNFGPEPELEGETTTLMIDGVLYATAGLTRNPLETWSPSTRGPSEGVTSVSPLPSKHWLPREAPAGRGPSAAPR